MNYTHKQTHNDVNKIEYEVTVAFDELKPFEEQAYNALSKSVKIEGFRPGKAPRQAIVARLGVKLINESVGRLLPAVAFDIIDKEKMQPVNTPDYDLVDLSPEKGVIFKFWFTNYPSVTLGDFSKIKVKKEDIKTTEEDVDTVVKSIVRSSVKPERIRELTKVTEIKPASEKAKDKKSKDKKAEEDHEGHDHSHDDHDHSHEGHDHEHDHSHEDKGNFDFELNDALITELGYEKEQTLKDVQESVRKRLDEMKAQQAEEKYVGAVVEELIKLSKFEIPDRFIKSEVEATEKDFNNRLEDLKLEKELYLKTQGVTYEQKLKDWEEQARKRVSADIILINIAMQNDKLPTEEDIEKEIATIQDPSVRASYQTDNGRRYIRGVLTKQNGLHILLEKVK